MIFEKENIIKFFILILSLSKCNGLFYGYGIGDCSQKVPIIKNFDINKVYYIVKIFKKDKLNLNRKKKFYLIIEETK